MGKGQKKIIRADGRSIRTRIALPVLGVLILQTILYVLLLSHGELVSHMDGDAMDIFSRQTDNLELSLENDMIHRWSSLGRSEEEILESISMTLQGLGKDYSDIIGGDTELNEQILLDASENVVELLRRNNVTGAFLVLDGRAVPGETGEGSRAALYIRDNDPATYSAGNSDLMLERGLPSIAAKLGVTLDSFWAAAVYKTDFNDFFLKPIEAARKDEAPKSENYGYWAPPFSLAEMDRDVITYAIPLIASDGTVFGAMGVDISVDYLVTKLKSNTVSEEEATFAMVWREGDSNQLNIVAQSGKLLMQYYTSTESVLYQESDKKGFYTLDTPEQGNGKLYCSLNDLKLYNVNTPFEHQKWGVIGLKEESNLFALSRRVASIVYLISVIMLFVGTAVLLLAIGSITRPMKKLLVEVGKSDPMKAVSLPKLGISEVDSLSESIERLSTSVAESASRFSKIVQKTNMLLGVFEYQVNGTVAYCSDKLFDILEWENPGKGDQYLDLPVFRQRMKELELYEQEKGVTTYQLNTEEGYRWVSITSIDDGVNCLGVVVDITSQIVERRKIEYERDYDLLTHLHNRRSFIQETERLFQNPEQLKVAAVLMWDLDNLKYINDTYGHDYGDSYIISFAETLKSAAGQQCLVARRSGDEFYLFFHGFDTREALKRKINDLYRQVDLCYFHLPNGKSYKIRASGGIAWYPQDADNIDDLVRYADFAMYSVKHTTKGSVEEFNQVQWQKNALLVNGQEVFDRLIDEEQVRFFFQPIVEVATGNVMGYEALMRPMLPQFSGPEDVLMVARSQSKLFLIERLTVFGAIKAYIRQLKQGKIKADSRIFINSLSNQCLNEQDVEKLELEYSSILKNIVLEITESEVLDSTFQTKKHEIIRRWGGQLAIDDYGTGYSSMSMLLKVDLAIIKVDMSIIRSIDKVRDKQRLLETIVSYAKPRGIRIVAEGVETEEEMRTCVRIGVDLIQGYYLAKPMAEVTEVDAEGLVHLRQAYREFWEKE